MGDQEKPPALAVGSNHAGQRVRFTEYQGDRGLGIVRGTRGDPQYVLVLFDNGHEGHCHPDSVEILPREDAA